MIVNIEIFGVEVVDSNKASNFKILNAHDNIKSILVKNSDLIITMEHNPLANKLQLLLRFVLAGHGDGLKVRRDFFNFLVSFSVSDHEAVPVEIVI